jgi:hypothetical protein
VRDHVYASKVWKLNIVCSLVWAYITYQVKSHDPLLEICLSTEKSTSHSYHTGTDTYMQIESKPGQKISKPWCRKKESPILWKVEENWKKLVRADLPSDPGKECDLNVDNPQPEEAKQTSSRASMTQRSHRPLMNLGCHKATQFQKWFLPISEENVWDSVDS